MHLMKKREKQREQMEQMKQRIAEVRPGRPPNRHAPRPLAPPRPSRGIAPPWGACPPPRAVGSQSVLAGDTGAPWRPQGTPETVRKVPGLCLGATWVVSPYLECLAESKGPAEVHVVMGLQEAVHPKRHPSPGPCARAIQTNGP